MEGKFALIQSAYLRPATTTLLLSLAIPLLGPSAFAQEFGKQAEEDRSVTYGTETDFNSGYVWRGISLNDQPVMQPSAWVSKFGFTFTGWSNLPLTNTPENARWHATDLILMYSRDWGKLTIQPAVEAYLNWQPRGVRVSDFNTMESSLELSYPAGPLRLFTSHAFDVLAYRGSYFGEAGVAYEGRFKKKTAFGVSVHAAWASSRFNDVYIGLDKRAFNLVGADVSVTYHLTPHLYFRPHLEFSDIANQQLRRYLPSPTIINVGLAAGVEF